MTSQFHDKHIERRAATAISLYHHLGGNISSLVSVAQLSVRVRRIRQLLEIMRYCIKKRNCGHQVLHEQMLGVAMRMLFKLESPDDTHRSALELNVYPSDEMEYYAEAREMFKATAISMFIAALSFVVPCTHIVYMGADKSVVTDTQNGIREGLGCIASHFYTLDMTSIMCYVGTDEGRSSTEFTSSIDTYHPFMNNVLIHDGALKTRILMNM